MSTFVLLVATATAGFLTGWLCARWRIRELHHLLHAARHAADHDHLTGLPNRATAERTFDRRQPAVHPTLVVLIDLDRFKAVNDTHGHRIGDALLRVVANRLAAAVHSHGGTAARMAGDEFLLLLPADPDSSLPGLAGKILDEVSRPAIIRTDGDELTITPQASAGIAVHDGTHHTFAELLRQADIALYHAKQQRGTHRVFSHDMRMPSDTAGPHTDRPRDQRPAGADDTSPGEADR